MLVLQVLGTLALLVAWAIELSEGVIAPWDRILLPGSALLIGTCTWVGWRWPRLERPLRPVPMSIFNLFLVVTLDFTLGTPMGEQQQRYEVLSTLYWVPLGYGCAFVFLGLRAAVAVSGMTAAGIFLPLLAMASRGALPAWASEGGPLLAQVALSHVMFLALLIVVVRLRGSHERAEAQAQLMKELAATDMLTGLPNRRAMAERLHQALAWSDRGGEPVSVALVDVDRFKSINDRFGHAAGDAALQEVANALRSQVRASDALCRWGGEEFLVLAQGAEAATAIELAERLRREVAQSSFAHAESVTVSVGLATRVPGESADSLLQRADRALYRAKDGGRNCVALPEQLEPAAAI